MVWKLAPTQMFIYITQQSTISIFSNRFKWQKFWIIIFGEAGIQVAAILSIYQNYCFQKALSKLLCQKRHYQSCFLEKAIIKITASKKTLLQHLVLIYPSSESSEKNVGDQ